MREKVVDKALKRMLKKRPTINRKSLGDMRFNNGEPIAVAGRKVLAQLLIIAAVLVALYGLLFMGSIVRDYLSNDSTFSLTMNSNYKEILLLEGDHNYTAGDSTGISAAAAVSKIIGDEKSEAELSKGYSQDPTKFISGMTSFLENSFPDCIITPEENISNYTMMTEIYENLKNGNGVIVSMGSSEDEYAIVDDEIIYALVIGVNFTEDTVTVVTPYGRTETIFTEDFIAKTRFDNFEDMSFLQKSSFVLGYRAKNSIYFIEKQ